MSSQCGTERCTANTNSDVIDRNSGCDVIDRNSGYDVIEWFHDNIDGSQSVTDKTWWCSHVHLLLLRNFKFVAGLCLFAQVFISSKYQMKMYPEERRKSRKLLSPILEANERQSNPPSPRTPELHHVLLVQYMDLKSQVGDLEER
ncbi:uncharacterized protein LOC124285499 [Haliotis rubra]|uniref:uncharacterized protein LOC124285499 n=1 Tax=Haliotis rubra TaxID=36100 RepID=UPI001EE5612B|nr:uncharacterized protein LOC124285499 [Haliotis rubra]